MTMNAFGFFWTIMAIVLVVDFTLYLLVPYDNIRLVGFNTNICEVGDTFSSSLGCAWRGSGLGYIKLPSFLIASHEDIHAKGYGEPMALTHSYILIILYTNAAYWFIVSRCDHD